ncbi:MAG: DMT family transporter [Clostridia bacterium]|nr:DMT family transporter [Clostridia bacterium]
MVTLLALICCALWGSATPFIKKGYEYLLPENNVPSIMLFAGIRFLLAGIITVIIYSVARRKLLYPRKENLPKVAVLSAFQTILQYIFFYIGLANTSGVKGTIASGCNVFFAILISSLIFRQEKLSIKKIVACILGFAGIIIVNLNGLTFNMNFLGDGFVLISAMSSGASSVFTKIYSKHEDPVVLSGYQFILGGFVMIIIGLAFGGVISPSRAAGIGVLIYLAFLSAIAYSLWGILLKHNPVSSVTIFSFMTPVFGVLLSKLMLTESSNVSIVNLLITLALVCTGIFILNYRKPEKPAAVSEMGESENSTESAVSASEDQKNG